MQEEIYVGDATDKEEETSNIIVKEAIATTRRDSPFQGTWNVNPEYLESLLSSSTFFL